MQAKLHLENDFHRTSVTLHPARTLGGYVISMDQARRARRELCGSKECKCGRSPAQETSAELVCNKGEFRVSLVQHSEEMLALEVRA